MVIPRFLRIRIPLSISDTVNTLIHTQQAGVCAIFNPQVDFEETMLLHRIQTNS
jgi:hypothetical protein